MRAWAGGHFGRRAGMRGQSVSVVCRPDRTDTDRHPRVPRVGRQADEARSTTEREAPESRPIAALLVSKAHGDAHFSLIKCNADEK